MMTTRNGKLMAHQYALQFRKPLDLPEWLFTHHQHGVHFPP
jgi:hypothetical protein